MQATFLKVDIDDEDITETTKEAGITSIVRSQLPEYIQLMFCNG